MALCCTTWFSWGMLVSKGVLWWSWRLSTWARLCFFSRLWMFWLVPGGLLRASFEPRASIKLRATFALRAPCVNIGNFIGFFSKSIHPRPQRPIWPILDKKPNFWAWFSETYAPHTGLRFWVLSLRITENQQNALWGWTLEYTWNFVQYSKIQGKSVV